MEPGSSRPGRGCASSIQAGLRVGSAAPESEIEVILAAPGWRAAVRRPEALARRAAEAALREAGAAGAITVLLADDRALKQLNTRHRGKEKPTNVLSFPPETPGERVRSRSTAGAQHESAAPAHIGDLALALGTVRREAHDAGRRVADHLAHLVAHGALHLAGHDHLAAGEARRMERAEARVMRRLGRPNPWRGAT